MSGGHGDGTQGRLPIKRSLDDPVMRENFRLFHSLNQRFGAGDR